MHYVDNTKGKGKVKYGVYFLSPIEDPEDEQRRLENEKEMNGGDVHIQDAQGQPEEKDTEITLTLLLNRISGGKYKSPAEFWKELGLMFKNCMINYPDEASSYRKMGDKLRVLAYHLYVDWYSLFGNKEKDMQRRMIEAERVNFIEMRNKMRETRREEWKKNSEEPDFNKEKNIKQEGGENDSEEDKGDKDDKDNSKEEKKDDKKNTEEKPDSPKKEEGTFKESVNEGSLATSNAFPATTQDNISMVNPQRDNTYQGDAQMSVTNQAPSNQQNNMNMNSNNGMMNQPNQNMNGQNMNQMGMNQLPGMNQQNMGQQNMGQQNMGQQNMNQPNNPNSLGSRLPSLSTLPITNAANQQNMMNPNFRIPSMFGQNFAGNQMNMGGMNYQGQNPGVFQGGRIIQPGFNPGNMNPYPNNMNPMMQYPGMQQNQYYNNMNQMQRPGMMGYNQNMPGYNPMMQYGMNGQFSNPMMMRNGPYGNSQYPMMPPGQQMAMTRNMAMNQNMQRAPKTLDSLIQGGDYVPGTLEEGAINALTNTDFKYGEEQDLLAGNYNIADSGEQIDPGPYDLTWLLTEGETEQDFSNSTLFTPEELNMIVSRAMQFEQLYLVKWMNLSYTEATWEPYSLIQQYDELIEGFEIRNKRLNSENRNRIQKDRDINRKLVEYLGISEKKKKNFEEDDIDNHLKLFKYRLSLFNNKTPYDLYKKDKGQQPVFKKGQRLKEYQINGANWLVKAWHENRNVILADEMGLGKTVQTISYYNYLYTKENNPGPFCVIAPLTTLSHWKKVVDEWTDMNAVLYYDQGGNEGRSALRLYEWFYTDITNDGRPTQKYKIFKFNIILTSFEVFCSDLYSVFLDVPFR